ncbi:MAG: AEC family transporter [Ruminococcaceae bacterium]|nr:AEC family transporter [Oscillospiraceae bacterium]
MGIEVIARQIAMLFIMMALGFIGVKTKFIQVDLKDAISQVIVKFTLPLLSITAITGQTMRPEMFRNAFFLVMIELCMIALMYLLAMVVSKLFHLPPQTATVHNLMSTFGNVAFLGYPLITALLGPEGLFYAIIYTIVNDAILWTVGVFLIAKSSGIDNKSGVKMLINPTTISYVVALFMLALGLKLPTVIHETFAAVGSMTTSLAMLFIGITLGSIPLRGIYKKISIYMIVFFKMLVIPAILVFVLSFFRPDATMMTALVLQVAMPVQTIVTVMASDAGSDYQYAAECVFITTVASLVTLPVVYYFMQQII